MAEHEVQPLQAAVLHDPLELGVGVLGVRPLGVDDDTELGQ